MSFSTLILIIVTVATLIDSREIPITQSRDTEYIFGNNTYTDKIFFNNNKNTNTNTPNCASTSRCCRYRCPMAATPMCGAAPTSTLQCAAVPAGGAVAGGVLIATAAGMACRVRNNCANCFTDNTIACAAMLSCTQVQGSDICPWTT